METSSSSLTALRTALALRKKKKALTARLFRNKANAMEAVYGFTASLPFRRVAWHAETSLERLKA